MSCRTALSQGHQGQREPGTGLHRPPNRRTAVRPSSFIDPTGPRQAPARLVHGL